MNECTLLNNVMQVSIGPRSKYVNAHCVLLKDLGSLMIGLIQNVGGLSCKCFDNALREREFNLLFNIKNACNFGLKKS
jgi:hypothetical protein